MVIEAVKRRKEKYLEGSGIKKKTIITCVIIMICLAVSAAAAAAVTFKRNPLEKGLMNLAQEVMAQEEELGEHFWADTVNWIGSENIQTEYSLNIGGIPELQNMTVGIDGTAKRDMQKMLFEADFKTSVANTELGRASVFGTADTLYVQVPSVWNGSVVFGNENVSGQWDDSEVRAQVQALTKVDLEIGQQFDVKPFTTFSVKPVSISGYLRENAEVLKSLYENMEVVKLQKAQASGRLSEEQTKELAEYELTNGEGEQRETTCYLVVLPGEELGEIMGDIADEIRLGVYLDQEDRIVRIRTLPGEAFITGGSGEGSFALSLTGENATVDEVEGEFSFVGDRSETCSALADKTGARGKKIPTNQSEGIDEGEKGISSEYSDMVEVRGSFALEKNREEKGSRYLEGVCFVDDGGKIWELSAEGDLQGKWTDEGRSIFVDLESLALRSQDKVVCRISGNAAFMPLSEPIERDLGKEYRIGDMNELETIGFLAECVGNLYKNYAGYMKILEGM